MAISKIELGKQLGDVSKAIAEKEGKRKQEEKRLHNLLTRQGWVSILAEAILDEYGKPPKDGEAQTIGTRPPQKVSPVVDIQTGGRSFAVWLEAYTSDKYSEGTTSVYCKFKQGRGPDMQLFVLGHGAYAKNAFGEDATEEDFGLFQEVMFHMGERLGERVE